MPDDGSFVYYCVDSAHYTMWLTIAFIAALAGLLVSLLDGLVAWWQNAHDRPHEPRGHV